MWGAHTPARSTRNAIGVLAGTVRGTQVVRTELRHGSGRQCSHANAKAEWRRCSSRSRVLEPAAAGISYSNPRVEPVESEGTVTAYVSRGTDQEAMFTPKRDSTAPREPGALRGSAGLRTPEASKAEPGVSMDATA